jgi:hypothetical protein
VSYTQPPADPGVFVVRRRLADFRLPLPGQLIRASVGRLDGTLRLLA